MTALITDIRSWVAEGLRQGATHVIIACDTYDHENYPVYVQAGEDVTAKVIEIRRQSMQTVDEVYDLVEKSIDAQLVEARAFHPPQTRTAGLHV